MSVTIHDVHQVEYIWLTLSEDKERAPRECLRFGPDDWLTSKYVDTPFEEAGPLFAKDLEKAYQEHKKGKNETL